MSFQLNDAQRGLVLDQLSRVAPEDRDRVRIHLEVDSERGLVWPVLFLETPMPDVNDLAGRRALLRQVLGMHASAGSPQSPDSMGPGGAPAC